MYQILNLSLEEDNERTASQAFSCRSVVFERLRVPVRTCVCSDGSGGEKVSRRVCVFLLNSCAKGV